LSEYYGLDDNTNSESNNQQQQLVTRKEPLKSAMRKLTPSSGQPAQVNPYDINSPDFDADLYVSRLVSQASLSQLMAQEGEVVKQIQGLDSDMQTLVYENYNKFIAATETIRKMRVDFKSMENEMEQLAASMTSITTFSSQISDKLRGGRQEVARLSSAHATLQKLQFVLGLPDKLKQSIDDGKPGEAVQDWLRAERALKHYKEMPSFAGIQEDCDLIMMDLKTELMARFSDPECDNEQLGQAVDLLRQLGVSGEQLCESYLQHCSRSLQPHLDSLQHQCDVLTGDTDMKDVVIMDPLQFVDEGCNKFLAELSLAAAGYNNTFNNPATGKVEQGASQRLSEWLSVLMQNYLQIMQKRLSLEQSMTDCSLLVRSLDRFYRRLMVTSKLVPGLDLITPGLDVVLAVSREFSSSAGRQLGQRLEDRIMDTRQTIAQPRRGADQPLNLEEVGTILQTAISENIKNVLTTLMTFLDPELSFSAKTYFKTTFCVEIVQESVMMKYFRQIVEILTKLSQGRTVSPALLLLLSRTCHDLHTSTTGHVATVMSAQYHLVDTPNMASVNTELASMSQTLLDTYVKLQAADLSLMIRKSVEARDWLSTVEPRAVRAVMKRVVEDVSLIDEQVGQLYQEGQRKLRSSDSSRTFGNRSRSVFSNYTNSTHLDSSLASNIQKLFSEKIDYFAPVTNNKVSVLTGIIKLGLKTLLECVRLKTFARYGLQQMQVDCHYLQLYLWRFVDDEAIVHHLLDEVLSSALHRSLEQPPILMEHSVVEMICDKNG